MLFIVLLGNILFSYVFLKIVTFVPSTPFKPADIDWPAFVTVIFLILLLIF